MADLNFAPNVSMTGSVPEWIQPGVPVVVTMDLPGGVVRVFYEHGPPPVVEPEPDHPVMRAPGPWVVDQRDAMLKTKTTAAVIAGRTGRVVSVDRGQWASPLLAVEVAWDVGGVECVDWRALAPLPDAGPP